MDVKAIRTVITNETESFEVGDGEDVIDVVPQPYTNHYQVIILTEGPFECGEETSDGGACQRTVGGPDATCSLHEDN